MEARRCHPPVKENFPLGDLTTFKIGGPARYFASITCEEQLAEAMTFARESGSALFVLGGGSNILVSDEGFPGLVIHNRLAGFAHRFDGGSVYVTAGAGEDWDGIVRRCVEEGWQGLECLSGVPGTAGAAPVQNIGAYGQSAGSVISEVRALDTHTGEAVFFTGEECGFGYRRSIFNSTAAGRYIITAVTFRLVPGGVPVSSYHALERQLREAGELSLLKVREAVFAVRNAKGLLVLNGYDIFRSAGSFFKNPVIQPELYEEIKKTVADAGGCENWAWPQTSGEIKVSAACLIQCAGFVRGLRRGAVGISPRHTLIIINHRDAKAGEVIAFAREIREKVLGKFHITIQPEVQFVGFSNDRPLL
jgi:UDP-N-acetylmuramate dehydrogenase